VWDGKQMVSFAQVGGGSLRNDQIEDLVNFVTSWNKGENYTTEDLFAVEQFMKLKADAADVTEGEPVVTIIGESGDDIVAATTLVAGLTGDAARGEQLYNGDTRSGGGQRLACSTCHTGGAQAPATDEKWDTAATVRTQLPEFAGWSVEQYLIHSIIYPNEYVVPGYASGVMPNNYGEQLTSQDLADMLAYLKTYSTAQ
jgi:mono/diheme cytochrome c family protein